MRTTFAEGLEMRAEQSALDSQREFPRCTTTIQSTIFIASNAEAKLKKSFSTAGIAKKLSC
jgi:hypothetical protein